MVMIRVYILFVLELIEVLVLLILEYFRKNIELICCVVYKVVFRSIFWISWIRLDIRGKEIEIFISRR